MPFSGPSDPKLPSNVVDLSLETRREWVGAWNGRFDQCKADGGSESDCESSAFAVANAAIKEIEMGSGKNPEETPVAEKAPEKDMHEDDEYQGWSSPTEPSRPDYWDYMQRQTTQEFAEYDPVGGDATKACANCQWFVAPSGCTVVQDWPQPILPTGVSNLWLQREVFEAKPLEVTIVGSAERSGEKQETKTEGGVEYAASDFAVVPDAATPSGWKLRLAEGSSGDITVAQVARAITAMQPSGFRGNPVELTSEQKSQAVSRIGTAIGKTGGTDEQKDNLRDRLDAVKEAGTIERTIHAIRKALPAPLQAILGGKPVGERPGGVGESGLRVNRSALKVYKDADGSYRFVAWASNKWRDHDNPPDIITEGAHKEHVAYLDQSGHYPEMWLWHTPGTKWAKVDWADYADGFFVVSGTVDKGKENVAESLADDPDLGVSHGFVFDYDGVEGAKQGIITQYRTFEISPLPHAAAANPWTSLALIQKEVAMAFEDKKRAWLVTHLGEDIVAEIEGGTKTMADALTAAKIEFKDVPQDSQGTPPVDRGTPGELGGSEAVKAMVETLTGLRDGVAALKAQGEKTDAAVAALNARLDAAEKTDDERLADAIRSRATSHKATVNGKRASESPANKVGDKDEEDAGKASQAERNSDFFGEVVAGLTSD